MYMLHCALDDTCTVYHNGVSVYVGSFDACIAYLDMMTDL